MPFGRIVPVAERPVVFMDEPRTESISVRIPRQLYEQAKSDAIGAHRTIIRECCPVVEALAGPLGGHHRKAPRSPGGCARR